MTSLNTVPTAGNGPATTTGASAGAGLGSKIKGAFQTVHGMGERLRGNVNDAADAAVGDRQTDAGRMHGAGVTKAAENTATDRLGRAEQAEGMDRMMAPAPATTGTTTTGATTTDTTTY